MSVANTHFGANRIKEMLSDCHSVFFIGIGGINMSSLAHATLLDGKRVGGSDRARSALTERLSEAGAEVFYSHDEANLRSYDALVYTVAISEDNPEYLAAIRDGKPCISRADYMGYLMSEYRRRIGISGMHGKSTCTSMCALTLMRAGADPTVMSGAVLSEMDGAYRIGSKENFLFEACEYMDSFLDFNPNIAVVLNIEMDHVDYFHSMEQIKHSYRSFASITGEGGRVIANGDDENVIEALEEIAPEVIYFGINSTSADIRAENISSEGGRYAFDIVAYGDKLCRVHLSVSGYHNIYNSLATAAVALECGLGGKEIKSGLEAFGGAARRMEYKGKQNGARVYDDYAHHPTEIRSTLEGAKQTVGKGGRLFCVFQSHTYSRTAALLDEFAEALSVADRAIICDIYAARETDTLGITPELFASKIEGATACHGFSEPAEILKRELREGDVAIIMGAGDVWHVLEHLELKK